MKFFGFFLSALLSLACNWVLASEPVFFDNDEQEERFNRLTTELRCVVCQNQNLADSDAQLAHDLRKEIHGMILSGRSDEEIKTFLVQRYGDFVLYRPPVKGNTLALWIAPAVLLLLGALVVFLAVWRRTRAYAAQQNGEGP